MKSWMKGKEMGSTANNAAVLAMLFSTGMTLGCSAQDAGTFDEANLQSIDTQGAAVIGGIKATSPELNVVGSLTYKDPYYGDISPFCSATLIGPETALTARHCVDILDDLIYYGYGSGFFSVGADGTHPDQMVRIIGVDTPADSFGGFIGFGKDVAVVHLTQAVAGDFNFAKFGASEGLVIGEPLVSVGFGVYSAGGAFDGKRRIGRETVAATSGRAFEAMFGDFESFVEWYLTGEVTESNILDQLSDYSDYIEYLYDLYVEYELIPGSEMVAGLAATDTQSCYGDSGGPMMRFNADGTFTVMGVVSGGLNSRRSACDYGGVYATFDPDIVEFLDQALQWQDPCGETPDVGTCADLNTLSYCRTALIAGIRQVETVDCAASGVECVENEYGAGCGAAPLPPPPPPSPDRDGGAEVEADAGSAEATPALDVLEMVRFRYYPNLNPAPVWMR